MTDNIKSFRLSDVDGRGYYNRVLLQLFGLPGNGKSSFINSCKYVINGGVFVAHAEPGDSYGGKTMKRISHELTDSIRMVDNRGMSKLNRFQTGEILAQLGNLLPLNQEVEWVEEFNTNVDRVLAEFNNEDSLRDLIVPILIHSAKIDMKNNEELREFRELLNSAREMTGFDPYIVLTHKYNGELEAMKSVFRNMGFQKIYTIENYTAVCQPMVREKHEEIIQFLNKVLEDIRFRMGHMGDPKEERKGHLNFILKYMKKTSDLKKHEEYINKKREEELGKNTNSSCILL